MSEPCANLLWKKSRNDYAALLMRMISEGDVKEPFNRLPKPGPLQSLPPYMVRTRLKQFSSLECAVALPLLNRRVTDLRSERSAVMLLYGSSTLYKCVVRRFYCVQRVTRCLSAAALLCF